MQFGFTLKPEHSIERTVALAQQAEAAGFEYGWLFDSHVLWRDPYPLLTLMARATTKLRLGTCVTNPATREPTVTASSLAVLDELSGGRMDLGIGRGDSARRVIGKGPTSMKDLEDAVHVIRALVEGQSIEFEGTVLDLPWTSGYRLPVWIAGYGPGGAPADRPDRRRGDAPDRRPGSRSLVRLAGASVGVRGGPRPERGQGHGRRAGPRRRSRRRARPDPLVPGPRREPRRRPGQQVPARGPAGRT